MATMLIVGRVGCWFCWSTRWSTCEAFGAGTAQSRNKSSNAFDGVKSCSDKRGGSDKCGSDKCGSGKCGKRKCGVRAERLEKLLSSVSSR
jgi:hypothetical protein